MSAAPAFRTTILKRLRIDQFRGLKSFIWRPAPHINFILGGGDVGKSTVLEAIALLLSPTGNYALSDNDYYDKKVAEEFVIEAVVSVADGVPISEQRKMNWPWDWNGEDAVALAEGEKPHDPVYRFRVRGTAELELSYEVVQPSGEIEGFSTTLRRAIGIVRLSGDERNDRDLRLVQGSALDRMLDDKGFRARAGQVLGASEVGKLLNPEAQKALGSLSTVFRGRDLPGPLDLGVTGGAGMPLNALIGLTAAKAGVSLPLINWGAGTRRLAALTIAGALHERAPITLVDEIERGLECYRQRILIRALRESASQVFATTHSPVSLRAASDCSFWYLDSAGVIGPLEGKAVRRQLGCDPEAFLARTLIAAEGATEVGFVTSLLEQTLDLAPADYGIHVTDTGSNEGALELLESLSKSGLQFAGMADNENKYDERWAKVKACLGDRLLRWQNICLEQEIFACLTDAQLESFIVDPAGELTGYRLRTLAIRLGCEEKDFHTLQAKAGANFRRIIAEAFLGIVPAHLAAAEKPIRKTYQAHAQNWFKSIEGGRELAQKVVSLKLWPKLQDRLLPFLNAIRGSVGQKPVAGLGHE